MTSSSKLKGNKESSPIANIKNFKSIKELHDKIQNIRSSDGSNLTSKLPTAESNNAIMSPANKYVLVFNIFYICVIYIYYIIIRYLFILIICIYFIFRVLEEIKIPFFCLQLSLTRASSMVNETDRSHFDNTSRINCGKDIKMGQVIDLPLSLCMERIRKSTDVMAAKAEKLFYDCEYKRSIQILNEYVNLKLCIYF